LKNSAGGEWRAASREWPGTPRTGRPGWPRVPGLARPPDRGLPTRRL